MRTFHAASIVLFCIMVLCLSGCMSKKNVGVSYQPPYDSLNNRVVPSDSGGSLFPSDQAVLNDDAIDKILNARVTLPEKGRLTVIKLSAGRNAYWSEQSVTLDRETTDRFLAALRQCPRIETATVLPSVLVPDKLSVPYLREAAARYQSNLLLAYRVTGGEYTKYRATRPDQVKAYCAVEAFLLDVRSGIVPLTTTGFHEISAQKLEGDISFSETIDKAFRSAEAEALIQVAEQVRSYLGTL